MPAKLLPFPNDLAPPDTPAGPDPLLYDFPLPLSRTFYPLGYAVEVVSNSAEVLAIADEIWGQFQPLWTERTTTIRIAVQGPGSGKRALAPRLLGQRHLISFLAGPDGFLSADLDRGFAFGSVPETVVRDRGFFRYHYLEPVVYLILGSLFCTPVHSSCVARGGKALLLCGDSGAGKTTLAYACARSGWTYLTDDASYLIRDRDDFVALGRPHQIRFRESARKLFAELDSWKPKLRPNGKLDLEIDTAELGIGVTCQGSVQGVVFLRRTGEAIASVEPIPPAEAFHQLCQVLCFGDQSVRREQKAQLWRLVQLPLVCLSYGDSQSGVQALDSFLNGLLDVS